MSLIASRTSTHHRASLPKLNAICAALALLAVHSSGTALPTGAAPTFGSTAVSADGKKMTIVQGSDRAGIDWRTFSIASGERVNILQPGTGSILFNRVLGNDPSMILGNLQANGRVFLSNPRGVVFGQGSRIDVGSLVATTLNLSDPDMLAGRFNLTRNTTEPGELIQDGVIRASGTVALVAPKLTQTGSIEAPRIGLAAAESVRVDVEGDGLIFFNVNTTTLETRLKALGELRADGGTVDLRAQARAGFADTVLNLDGIVQARSVGTRNGQVFVDGGPSGNALVTGKIDVSGRNPGERGGEARVLGERVGLIGNARVDASGADGGGAVLIGGNWQGSGTERQATDTRIGSSTVLLADATRHGDGGTIVAWSQRSTTVDGTLSARGGALGGSGGSVETSGLESLGVNGRVDVSASSGHGGNWLLDPNNVTISTATTNPATFTNPFQDDGLAANATVAASSIAGALVAGGTVTVRTSGNGAAGDGSIRVETAVQPVMGAVNATLELIAHKDVVVNQTIAKAGAGAGALSLGLYAGAGSSGSVADKAIAGSQAGNLSVNSALNLPGGTVVLHARDAVTQTARIIAANLELKGNAAFALTNAGNSAATLAAAAGTGAVDFVNTGALVVGTVNASAGIARSGDVALRTLGGNLTLAAAVDVGGANLRLQSVGSIVQNTGSTAITANALGARAGGDVLLGNTGNGVGAFSATAGGNVLFGAGSGYALSSLADSAQNVAGGPAGIDGTPVFSATSGIVTGATGTLELNTTSGTVSQAAARDLSAQNLVLRGAGAYTLANAGNNVAVLAADATATGGGAIHYVDADTLTVASVATANLPSGAALPTGFGIQRSGDVALRTLGGDLTLNASLSGANVRLQSVDSIVQSAGAISASALGANAVNDVLLGSLGNSVGAFSATAGGNVLFGAGSGYAVSALANSASNVAGGGAGIDGTPVFSATSGIVAGTTIELSTTSGTVSQAAARDLSAQNLVLRGAGAYALANAGNKVATLAVEPAGAAVATVRYTDADDLDVNQVALVSNALTTVVGIERAGSVGLRSVAGNLTLSEKIDLSSGSGKTIELEVNGADKALTQAAGKNVVTDTAGALVLRGAGTLTLTNAGNNVGVLAADAAAAGGGAIHYVDANTLTVASVATANLPSGTALPTGFGIQRSGDVALRTLVGDLTLSASLTGANVRLQSVDSIVQSAGAINASALGANAVNDVLLGSLGNSVGAFSATAGGNVLLGAGSGYAVSALADSASNVAGGGAGIDGTPVFSATSGIVAGATGTLELNTTSGTVSQAAARDLSAQNLVLRGAGGYALANAGNNVAVLAADATAAGGGAIHYVDANTLTVASVATANLPSGTALPTGFGIQRSGDVALRTLGGDLTLSASLSGANVRLQSVDSIVQSAGAISASALGANAVNDVLLGSLGNSVGAFSAAAGGNVLLGAGSGYAVSALANSASNVAGGGAGIDGTPVFSATSGIVAGTTIELNTTSGTVSQAAARDLSAQNLVLRGAGAYALANAGNKVATLAVEPAGAAAATVRYTDADDLDVNQVALVSNALTTVVGIERAGSVGLRSVAGNLTLSEKIDLSSGSGKTIELEVNGADKALTQAAGKNVVTDTAGALVLRGAGTLTLTNAGNNVGVLAADAAAAGGGAIHYVDANTLTVASVATANLPSGTALPTGFGIQRSGDVALRTLVGDLTLSASLTGANVRLQSVDSIVQSAGAINASALGANAVNDVLLGSLGNSVGAFSATAGGNVLLGAGSGYAVSALADSASNVAGGGAGIDGTPVFSATSGIVAGATGTLELNTTSGTVSQAAARDLSAQNLVLRGAGGYALANAGNNVAVLAADATAAGGGAIHYVDANTLTVASVATANLPSGTALPTGFGIQRSGDVALRTLGGDLTLSASLSGANVRLQSVDSIVQSAGAISASALGANAVNDVLLGSLGNSVGAFSAAAGGNVLLGAGSGYAVSALANSASNVAGGGAGIDGTPVFSATSGIVAGTTIELNTTSGTVSQAAARDLSAQNLVLRGAGAYALANAGNKVATLAVEPAGAAAATVRYTDADDLDVNQVALVSNALTTVVGIERAGSVGLRSVAGNLTLSEKIDLSSGSGKTIELEVNGADKALTQAAGKNVVTDTAGALVLRGAGTLTLTNAGNNVGVLAADAAAAGGGAIHYVDANTLTVASVATANLPSGTALPTGFGIQRSGDVALRTLVGDLTLSASLTGANVRLQSVDSIVQSAGAINASALGANAVNDVLLGSLGNSVGAFSATAGGNVLLGAGSGYAVSALADSASNVAGGGAGIDGTPVFSATSGIVTGATGTLELNTTSGTVSQAAARDLSAQNLVLRGAGAYALANAGNNVAVLAADATAAGGGAIHYVDASTLSVASVATANLPSGTALPTGFGIQRSGDVALRTLGGDLTLNASLSGANVRLQSVDSIVQSAGAISASALGANAVNDVLLGSLGNSVGAFSAAAGGNVLFGAGSGYAVSALANSASNVAGGGAGIDGTPVFSATSGIVAGTTIELNTTSGTVSQAAARDLSAQNLVLRGAGGYALANAGNNVAVLAADATAAGGGAIHYVDANTLTVASVATANLPSGTALPTGFGIQRSGDVALRTLVGDLTLNASLTGANVRLQSVDSIVQSAGAINASALGANAVNDVLLGSLGNSVGAFSATAAGNVLFGAGSGYALSSLADSAQNVAGGPAGIDGTPVFSATSGIVAGATGTLELNTTSGTVSQAAARDLSAQNLVLRGAGAYALANAGNNVAVLAADATAAGGGAIHYVDANTLTVASVATANLPSGTALPTGFGIQRSGDVALRTLGGDLMLSASLSGANVRLQSVDSIVQSAGAISASALGANAVNDVLLGSLGNSVGAFSAAAGGNLLFGAGTSYAVSALANSTSNVAGGGAGIDGTPIFSATSGIVAGTTIELNTTSGTVSQAAARDLSAQNLVLRGAGGYALANAGNNVAVLAADATATGGGAIHYVDANTLTVASVATANLPSGTALPAGFGIQRSGDVALRTLSGDLTLNASLAGPNVRLQSVDSIVQSAGAISASALGANAVNDVLLGSLGNSLGAFSASAGGNVLFGAAGGYAVSALADSASKVAGGAAGIDGTPVFSATSGIVAGATRTIELNTASGEATQAANRNLAAQNLLLRGAAAYTLTNVDNAVNNLAASTAGAADGVLRYVDKNALSVSPVTPVSGGAAVNGITRNNDVGLRTVAGNLTLNESINVSSAAGKNIELELSQAGSALTQAAGKNVLTSTTGGLLLRGQGSVILSNETNNVGLLAASGGATDGVLRYVDANALTVGSITPAAGGTATAGITRNSDVGLRTVAGNLTLNESINVSSAAGKNIELELSQAGSALTQAAGKIVLTSATGGLLLRGQGSVTLTNENNNVGLLAASGGATDGVLRYLDANALTVGSITPAAGGNAVTGITRNNDVGLRTVAGNLTLNESIDVSSAAGKNIELELSQAGSALTQAAGKNVLTSTTGGLLLRGQGSVILGNETNNVGLLAASGGATDGVLRYVDANALAVGSITPAAGGTAPAGITRNNDVSLRTVAGNLTLSETINLGTAGKADLAVGGNLSIANFESVGDLTATATGAVTFDGNFTAAGAGKTVDITSTLAGDPDPALRAMEIDRFVDGRKLGTTNSVYTPENAADPIQGGTLISIAKEVIHQSSGTVTVDQGTTLRLSSINDKPGSITLGNYDNALAGQVTARSANSASLGVTELAAPSNRTLSRIEINGNSINLGDSGAKVSVTGFKDNLKVGIEADLVRLGAESITTGDIYIVSRYRATSLAPFEYQLPGLVIEMRSPAKYVQDTSFGAIGDRASSALGEGPGLKVVLGYDTSLPASIGWVVLVPGDFKTSPTEHNGGSQEALAAFRARAARLSFSGPVEARPKYAFSAPGVEVNVPVFYNGQTPLNPAQRGALSAIVGLQEKLRREQLERAVSTENVARDLREGVIVEVGAGAAATTGDQGIREPEVCVPAAGSMKCGPAK